MNRPNGALLMATLLVWWWSPVGASRLRGSPASSTVRQNQQVIPQEEEAHYRFEIIIEQYVDVPEDGAEDVDVEPDPQHLICIEKSIMEEMPYIAQLYLERETSLSKEETSAGWGGVDKVTYKPPDGDGKVISVKNTGDGEKVFLSGSWTLDTDTQEEPSLATNAEEGNTSDLKHSVDYNATRDDENALRKMLMYMHERGLDSEDNSGSGPGESSASASDEEEASDGGISVEVETSKTESQTMTAAASDDNAESESHEEETSDGGVNVEADTSKTTPLPINAIAGDEYSGSGSGDNDESIEDEAETSDGEIELLGAGIKTQASSTKPPATQTAATKNPKKKKKKKKKKKAKKRWKGVFRIRTSCKFCNPDNVDNSRRALQDAEGMNAEHNHNARVFEKEEALQEAANEVWNIERSAMTLKHKQPELFNRIETGTGETREQQDKQTSRKTVEEENLPKVVDEGTKENTDRIDDAGHADFQSRENVPSDVGDGAEETTTGIDDTGHVDFQSWMNVYLAEQVKADCEMANTKETKFWFVDKKR